MKSCAERDFRVLSAMIGRGPELADGVLEREIVILRGGEHNHHEHVSLGSRSPTLCAVCRRLRWQRFVRRSQRIGRGTASFGCPDDVQAVAHHYALDAAVDYSISVANGNGNRAYSDGVRSTSSLFESFYTDFLFRDFHGPAELNWDDIDAIYASFYTVSPAGGNDVALNSIIVQ